MAEYIKREDIKYELWSVGPLNAPLMVVRKGTIDSIPAADVTPVVHGRWIPFEHWVHKTFWKGKACSVCNANIGHKTVFKFCPNCGAKMDGE